MKIIATVRTADIHVCLEEIPGVWAAGQTQDEAIGNLVQSYPEHFGVEIEWNREDPLTQRRIQESIKR